MHTAMNGKPPIEGRRALVTGAASGMLTASGAHVVLSDLDDPRLHEVAAALPGSGLGPA